MRILALAILLLGAAGARGGTTNDQVLADSARRAYEAGDHARALALYDSAAQHSTSAALEFNIGNCHFKLNDVPRAILHYERALLLAPGDDDIQANLDLARTLVVDRMNEMPVQTLGGAWERLRGGGDPDAWARRSLWTTLAFFSFLSLFVLGRARWVRRMALVAGGLSLIAGLVAVGFAAGRHREMTSHAEAIILAPKVDVMSEPRAEGTTLFVLHEGTKVTVLEERGGWSEAKLANGSVGWFPPNSLVRI